MKEIFEKIKKSEKLKILLAVILCACIVAIYFESSNKKEATVISNTVDIESSEEKLEKVLSNIKGVGNVKVMISYQSGSESVCASSTERQTNTVTEKSENGGSRESKTEVENTKPVTVGSGNGENALVIVEREPEIKGVIVVAQGAENVKIRLELQRAVETVLQIEPEQVEIFSMN